ERPLHLPGRPPARHPRRRPVPVPRAAARPAPVAEPGRDRLGDRWRRGRPEGEADAPRLGARHPRPVPRCGGAVLLQAVGRAHAEGTWPRARWAHLGRVPGGPPVTSLRGLLVDAARNAHHHHYTASYTVPVFEEDRELAE